MSTSSGYPLVFERLSGRALQGFTQSFAPGCHIILGATDGRLAELATLSLGVERPSSGKLSLGQTNVLRCSGARLKLNGLLPHEPNFPNESMRAFVTRRAPTQARGELERQLGACGLLERNTAQLTSEERRTVAFLLATSVQREALILYEPLLGLPGLDTHVILQRIDNQARAGAVVLVLSSSPSLCGQLDGEHWFFERGQLFKQPSPFPEATGSGMAQGPHDSLETQYEWVVECEQASELAAALIEHADMGVERPPSSPRWLIVRASALARGSLLITQICAERGLELLSLQLRPQSPEQLRAEVIARAELAYRRAYQAPSNLPQGNYAPPHHEGEA